MLTSILLNKNVRKKKNFFSRGINNGGQRFFAFTYARRTINLLVATVAVVLGLGAFHFLGSGFLPEPNEGSIYVRAQLPLSIN